MGRDTKVFYILSLTDIAIFATLLFSAYRARRDPPAHKRFIYVATTALLIAAIARLPFAFSYRRNLVAAALSWIFLLILVGYDVWSTRKPHRATLSASALLVIAQMVRIPVGKTAAWHAFATWVQHWAR